MKHLFCKFISTFFTLGWIFSANAQDPHFTQFYANPLYTNPATTGVTYSENGGRASLNYRNQWPALPGNFVTVAASWDQEFTKLKGGLGFLMTRDVVGEGLLSSKSLSALYAFKHKLGENLNLNYGIQAEFRNQSIDWRRFRFEDQIDPNKGFVNPTSEPYIGSPINVFNISAGVLAHHAKYFAGVALHNINQPNLSFYNNKSAILPIRLTIHVGYNFYFKNDENWRISPQAIFMKQNQFQQINAGCLASYKWFTFGTFYRHAISNTGNPADIIGVLGVRTKKWRFAYSYDRVISAAATAIIGSHEISLGYAYCRKKTSTEMHKGVMW
jgi:type IX secretion system PorP/SprF family membrane protein